MLSEDVQSATTSHIHNTQLHIQQAWNSLPAAIRDYHHHPFSAAISKPNYLARCRVLIHHSTCHSLAVKMCEHKFNYLTYLPTLFTVQASGGVV